MREQRAEASRSDYDFRNLIVWRKSQDLLVQVVGLCRSLPNDRVALVFANQLLRSASAISANIAEGHGRFSAGAHRNHLSIARGSTTETISWLDSMNRVSLLDEQRLGQLLTLCDEIMRMLSAKMIELDRRAGTSRTLRDERESYDA
jgi:four helix bundle protein